jgi:anthranilate synthase component 1
LHTVYPEKNEFLHLSTEYNVIPVYIEMRGDMYTAVSLFLKMRKARYQFLLESAVSGEYMGRYSFMGNSERAITCRDGRVSLTEGDTVKDCGSFDNPLDYVNDYFNRIEVYKNRELPPFVNGVVGYIGYDSIQYFEKIKFPPSDPLNVNDFELILADSVVVYDNLLHKLYIVCSPFLFDGQNPGEEYDKAVKRINQIAESLKNSEAEPEPFTVKKSNGRTAYKSDFSKERYEEAVEKTKEYIYKGDIFQLVLSQRLKIPVSGDAFNLYRSLRIINPSPYMFYLKCNDVEVIGSSPEIHVQLQDEKVTIRPIAGTRPRGRTHEEDRINEEALMAAEKERAAHIMLVDLARNDIGRVCQGGTVKVDDLMVVEYYSHVMHIVSNITGKLARDYNAFDLIKATFPAGTVSGAPKIRAMEIISELESERRGVYSGLIGYFSFDGNFDSCITIRTFVIKDGYAYLQAGAGLVADSVPEKEYYETMHKLRALTKAIEMAGEIV